jgi:hypothetical protein
MLRGIWDRSEKVKPQRLLKKRHPDYIGFMALMVDRSVPHFGSPPRLRDLGIDRDYFGSLP